MYSERLRISDRLKKTKVYVPRVNKSQLKRLNWEQIEARPCKEDRAVVKGTSKRIVVVKSPDPKVFEQAFFIVKEDFMGQNGKVNALKEAQKVADNYIKSAVASPRRLLSRMPPVMLFASGGMISALLSVIGFFLFR